MPSITVEAADPNVLNDSRQRLEAVLNNATVAVILMDARQHCVYMNKAAEDLTGFTLSEVLQFNLPLHDIVHHTHPDGRAFPIHECPIDRAFPECNQTQGEAMFVSPNGKFYPVAFTASPVRDHSSKTVGTVIELRNIAAEKEAQERQRMLTNEMNHRVKNTLAMVQAIAWQTFKKRDDSDKAVEHFNARLAVLSRAHQFLSEEAWDNATVMRAAQLAVEPFEQTRFRIAGPDCEITPRMAVNFCMIFHELATNSLKYGALSESQGRVKLTWNCQAQDTRNCIDMVWQEVGGPQITAPSRRGFGTRLIERQLVSEFGGKADLLFLPEGLTCRMRFELPLAPEH